MNIIRCKDYDDMSRQAVDLVARSLAGNPEALISFPGGDTPVGMDAEFVRRVNTGEVDISRARFVSLDEWVGLSETQPGSCAHFNRNHLLGPLTRPFAEVHLINGANPDIEAERQALDAYIACHGPLELSVLGIGLNGHLGFNEEGTPFDGDAHIVELSPVTTQVMEKYFHGSVHPEKGISQGLGQIMAAKTVILLASGAHKADIIARALEGEVTNSVPASVLQNHPNVYAVLDEAAASKLRTQ